MIYLAGGGTNYNAITSAPETLPTGMCQTFVLPQYSYRLVKLKRQCPDRPTETSRHAPKRLAKIKLPYGLKRWPDEERTLVA